MHKLKDAQLKKLPPKLKLIVERFRHEPQLLMKLKQLLAMSSQKVAQHALNHTTFCDFFIIPRPITKELLKLYGLTDKELKDEMKKIGFDLNRMYTDPYYQTLTIAYLIGLDYDDKNIRRLAMLLISILIWNGRKKGAFPTYCDPDVARYVQNYELPGNSTYKKSSNSAFEYLDSYNIPAFDEKYSKTIPDNLDHFTEGLRKLIESQHGRIQGVFRPLKRRYYEIYRSGKKEIISDKYGQQYGEGDMVEQKESFSGTIERLIDKMEKNAMLKRDVLMKPDAKAFIKKRHNISDTGLKKINDWIENDDNKEEVKYFFELVFNVLKPKSETDICQYDVEVLAKRITSSKKDPNLLKAKEILDHMLMDILGENYKARGQQTIYLRKLIASYALIAYMKLMLCKKL